MTTAVPVSSAPSSLPASAPASATLSLKHLPFRSEESSGAAPGGSIAILLVLLALAGLLIRWLKTAAQPGEKRLWHFGRPAPATSPGSFVLLKKQHLVQGAWVIEAEHEGKRLLLAVDRQGTVSCLASTPRETAERHETGREAPAGSA